MKLIPARCPSCGADIEVNKENETTKCKYCETRIIIDDAIEKYKVELSGKVTVENLPTVINLIKIGTRHLDKNEYLKAQEKFEKALELDADNGELIVKDCLARVAIKELNETNLNKVLTSLREAKEFCSEKELEELALFCVEHLDHKRIQMLPTLQNLTTEAVFFNLKQRLISFMNFYERVFRNYIKKDENKKSVIRKIFACIQNYRDNNTYAVYNYQTGQPTTQKYRIPQDTLQYLSNKELQYQDELAAVDPEYNSKLQQQRLLEAQELERIRKEREAKERKRKALIKKIFGEGLTKIINIIDLCVSGFLILISLLLILIGLTDNGVLSAIIALAALLFCVPNIVLRYIPFYKKLSNVIIIIISVVRYFMAGFLILLSIINMPDPGFVDQNFANLSDDETIEVGRNKMRISTYDYLSEKWTNEVYSYDYEYESSGRYILTIDYNTDMTADDTKYRYYEEDQKLCKLNYAENCITYYHIIKDAQ